MKKVMLIALCVVLVSSAGIALAKASKHDFALKEGVLADFPEYADAGGFYVLNETKAGKWEAQIQVWDLVPGVEYTVKKQGVVLGIFTANAKGHGKLHARFTADELGGSVNQNMNVWEGGNKILVNGDQ